MSQIDTTLTAAQVRDTVLTADDLGEELVDVPEWGVQILVKGMDGIERSQIQKLATSDSDHANAQILILVARHAETGDKLFTDADRDALSGKSGKAVEDVVLAAIRMSGASPDDAEKAVEADPFSDGV